MINLNSSTRIQAFLGGAITTREINYFVTYADRVTATGVTSLAVTVVSKSSGTSDVDICSAPAAGTIRSVLGIVVANVDTAAVECTIQLEDGSDWPFTPFTIAANRMAQFTKEGQWVEYSAGGGGGDALTTDPLSQFAATTSLQLKGVISDETGSGALVFATSPTLVAPALGTPASGTLTNCTGLPVAGVTGLTSVYSTVIVPIHADATGAVTMTTHPSTERFLANTSRNVKKFNFADYTEVRLTARVTTSSASVNSPRIRLRYKTSFSTTISDYGDIGASEVSCSVSATGLIDSGWIALVAGAKADVFITVGEIGGDSSLSPVVSNIDVHARRSGVQTA